MNYWLVKSDPETYGWQHFIKDGSTDWTGVRNHLAKRHLQSMKKNDLVLFYHSQTDKAVVGIAKVTKEAYPDKTAQDGNWVAVDMAPERELKNPVTLSDIKAERSLSNIHLVRQARLSVMPLQQEEFEKILEMGK